MLWMCQIFHTASTSSFRHFVKYTLHCSPKMNHGAAPRRQLLLDYWLTKNKKEAVFWLSLLVLTRGREASVDNNASFGWAFYGLAEVGRLPWVTVGDRGISRCRWVVPGAWTVVTRQYKSKTFASLVKLKRKSNTYQSKFIKLQVLANTSQQMTTTNTTKTLM